MRVKCCLCGSETPIGEALELDTHMDATGYSCVAGELLGELICLNCATEIAEWGSLLHYYGRLGSFSARFLDVEAHAIEERTVVYQYWTDIEDARKLMDAVYLSEEIMKTYTWQPSGRYTGAYQPKEDRVEYDGVPWERAIRAWAALMAAGEPIKRINKLIARAQAKRLDFPIVVVFPRSSNVAVAYMDLWAPTEHKAAVQKAILGEKEDAFSLERGFSVQRA